MEAVNVGVRTWNWTTGRTKKDLANGLLTVAPILEISGVSLIHPLASIPYLMFLVNSHQSQQDNERLEKKEINALNSGCLLNESEYLNKKRSGILYGGLSAIWFAPGGTTELGIIEGTGFGLRSLSHYVMRAEYLPPRKNVLSRAKDKLSEIVKEFKMPELPIPKPAIGCNYPNLYPEYN